MKTSDINQYNRERRKSQILAGKCSCGKPLDAPGKARCTSCGDRDRKYMIDRRNTWIKEGKCSRCGSRDILSRKNPRVERWCRDCFLKRTSYSIFRSTKFWKELGDIFDKQMGTCAYSDLEIVLGENASIDHIVPKYLGGKNELSNLQWVDYRVNLMKRNLLERDFLHIVARIAIKRGY